MTVQCFVYLIVYLIQMSNKFILNAVINKKINKVDHEKTSSRDLDDIVSEMSA